MPELVTEFMMEIHGINYKEASLKLYTNTLPTTHHIDTLMCTAEFHREVGDIMIQCVQGDLSLQWTHGILNATDCYLKNSNSIAKSVMLNGRRCVDSSCKKFIEDHGILKLGNVVSLSAGNLRCFFLFHAASLSSNDTCSKEHIFGILKKAIELAEHHSCKSLSIPLFKCMESDRNESTMFEAVTLFMNNLKTLKVIPIVCLDGKRLNRIIETIKAYDQ